MAYVRFLAKAASGGGSVAQTAKLCMYSNFPVSHYFPTITTIVNEKSVLSFEVSLTCKDRRLHPDLLLSRDSGRPGPHLWQHGLVVLPFSGLLHIRVNTVDIPLLTCHPGRPVHLRRRPGSGATPHHCIHTQFHTLSEKKRRGGKNYTFWRQFNENSSIARTLSSFTVRSAFIGKWTAYIVVSCFAF